MTGARPHVSNHPSGIGGPLVAAVALAVLLAAGCGSDEPSSSGVRGVVTIGPQCPVETVASPCPDLPFVGTVRASTQDGTIVREVRTDSDGAFRIGLEPGTYVLQAVVEGAGPPSSSPALVRVEAGTFVRVTLQVDTGIR